MMPNIMSFMQQKLTKENIQKFKISPYFSRAV